MLSYHKNRELFDEQIKNRDNSMKMITVIIRSLKARMNYAERTTIDLNDKIVSDLLKMAYWMKMAKKGMFRNECASFLNDS